VSRKIKGRVLILMMIVAASFLGWPVVQAQNPVSLAEAMAAANQQYEAGRFAEAAAGYEALVNFGLQNSAVYYNLGNTYFKMGDLGRAILNYRRASQLSPRDSDITSNLAIARAQTVDQLETSSGGTLANLVQIAEEWLTLQEAALLALALWLVLCILMVLMILLPGRRPAAVMLAAVVGFFLAVGIISMGNRYYTERYYPPAVVVASRVDVTSGPGSSAQYLVEFELHSGAEVSLLESRTGWRRIILSDELQGWVPAEAVEPVLNQR